MSPPTDVSGVRSSRDATIDAIVEALGLQIQAMLAERKAVALALGCDADETVLDAATRVAGDLVNTEKQIDDVRDILKAKVGDLTVDAATHAIVLAQNHPTLVKQVEQMERMLNELTRELDEARRRLKVEREHSTASDRHLVDTHEALGGQTGVEHVTEAAKRVAQERDAYRIRVKDMKSNVCKLSGERDEAKALAATLAKERDEAKALAATLAKERDEAPHLHLREAMRTTVAELRAQLEAQRVANLGVVEALAKERDDARALCVAVAAELYALPDEPVLAAAKRVAQDLRDEVDEARQARRDRDKALAELNAVRRILLPVNDCETTVDAAKRVVERRDEARADAGRMMKELDDVRSVLEARFNETTADAARRVVDAAHNVVDAAREVERTAKVVNQTQEAISTLEQKAAEKETAAILAALGARSGEKAVDVAKRVAKERDDLRAALQTVSHCQQVTARSFLSLAETLGVSPSDAASRVNSIIAREEEFRLAVAAYAQQDEELREIFLAGATERTLEAARRLAKAYEDTRKESLRLRSDMESIRKMTKAVDGETANAAVWRVLHVVLQHDQAREALSPQSAAETTVEAAKRVVAERDAAQASSRRFADVVRGVSATLGAREDEDAVTAAKRVVKERHDLRDELDKRMSL